MRHTYITILTVFLAATGIRAQNISRNQASADIDTLFYTLSEVHPNLYSNIGKNSLSSQFSNLKASFPDSLDVIGFYRAVAPVVALIGDAHTSMALPYGEIVLKAGKYIPVFPSIDSNTGRMYVKASVDNAVPFDSEILSINGISAVEMVSQMKSFIGGERDFFRLTMVDSNIMGLFHMLFSSSEYIISYREPDANQNKCITLQAVDGEKLNSGLVLSPKILKLMEEHNGNSPYSFRISPDSRVAIMNFDACLDVKGMEAFADSMFTKLHEQNISNLIIDVRFNGGGNSNVGDVLLKYLAPKPFAQFGKSQVRITPTTIALTGNRYTQNATVSGATPADITEHPASRHDPLPEAQRFRGNVYLLTSHTTFSSASSFAWAFKEAGCGIVIGEETGGMSVHYGDVIGFRLPNSGLSVNVSHKRFWLPGADENNIHGVIPDVICPQDEALETAIKHIEGKK